MSIHNWMACVNGLRIERGKRVGTILLHPLYKVVRLSQCVCVWVRLNTDRSLDAYRCHPVFVGRFAAGSATTAAAATAAANCQCGSAAFQTWLTRRLAASQSYYPLKVIWFSRVSSSSASVTFLLFYFDRMTCALCDIHFWSVCWAICRGFCKSIWLDAGGRDRQRDSQSVSSAIRI